MNKAIKLTNISKVYQSTTPVYALKDINLEIEKGKITAIIGQSGSGKSTLLNLMGTLDDITSGKITILGRDISKFSKEKLAYFRNKTIGFVFQFHYLLPEFTVLENVLMPHWISRENNKNSEKRASELLDLVGLSDVKHKLSTNISGGQKQRTAIARALMNQPPIILADEPTGNLDSKTSKNIHKLFCDLNSKLKTTFIIITHNQSIANNAYRKIELLDGKIIKDTKKKSKACK